MPRQARIDAPGLLHHVMARGVNGESLFLESGDYQNFLSRLGKLFNELDTQCYAWCLMPNHVHLLLQSGDDPLGKFMQRLLTGYAISFNRRHHRSGHLFQNRYKSIVCQHDTYLKQVVRYIHLNPLRADLVTQKNFEQFPYSGHQAILDHVQRNWQSIDPVLRLFHNERQQAQQLYRQFVADAFTVEASNDDSTTLISENKDDGTCATDKRILGSEDFANEIIKQEKHTKAEQDKPPFPLTFNLLVKLVGAHFHIPPDHIYGTNKQRSAVRARRVTCALAHRHLQMSMTQIAHQLGTSVATVSVNVHKGQQVIKKESLALENILKL